MGITGMRGGAFIPISKCMLFTSGKCGSNMHIVVSYSLAIPWTVTRQASLYWSGLPIPPPGHLPDPGIEPTSACISCIAGDSLPAKPSWKPYFFND